jgi:hypothetical protein
MPDFEGQPIPPPPPTPRPDERHNAAGLLVRHARKCEPVATLLEREGPVAYLRQLARVARRVRRDLARIKARQDAADAAAAELAKRPLTPEENRARVRRYERRLIATSDLARFLEEYEIPKDAVRPTPCRRCGMKILPRSAECVRTLADRLDRPAAIRLAPPQGGTTEEGRPLCRRCVRIGEEI